MSDPTVILEDVRKEFPKAEKPALSGLSARIMPGLVTGLVGPDGAGKSTLMRLMAGLLKPTKGKITICGMDPATKGDELRLITGYMPQKFGLYEDLTVQENLDLYADLRGVLGQERKDTFARLLEFTDLARFTSRPAGKLSGGMKQKLGLACALLGKPRLLLLDEPSVGVDPISRRELWRMVKELAGEGMAVIWSTAYLDEAELCAHVILLNEGEQLFAGPPAELTDHVGKRTRQIRNVEGRRREILARALRREEIRDGSIQGQAIRVVLAEGAEEPPLAELDAGPDAEYAQVPARFEDAFIDILGGGPDGESVLADHLPDIARNGETVIEARGLTRQFGTFVATDHVDFTVERGEIFGLLGPNGAGKSTTFKMMCGLLTPTAGHALVSGLDLQKSPGKARQKLGYMAQKFSLYGNLNVLQNLRFFSGVYGLRGQKQKDTIEEMIQAFALKPYLSTKADGLPLGFKQRLALACSVMHEPDILFLDEPTSGVDPVTRREFWMHINGVVEKGVTVMVTTHFMDEAEYCDRIGLIYRGKLIAIGTPDDLKAQAATQEIPDPTMEDAFIELVQAHDEEEK